MEIVIILILFGLPIALWLALNPNPPTYRRNRNKSYKTVNDKMVWILLILIVVSWGLAFLFSS